MLVELAQDEEANQNFRAICPVQPDLRIVVGREQEVQNFYTLYYKTERDDSPDASRTSILSRAMTNIGSLSPNDWVVDLGAGKGALEEELIQTYGRPNCKIATIDLATVAKPDFIGERDLHIQASGLAMPFPDESISVGISNMAIDFMGIQAVREFHRVLKQGAPLHLNLHNPDGIIPLDLDVQFGRVNRKITNAQRYGKPIKDSLLQKREVLRFKRYLRDNGILFSNLEEITGVFESIGFKVEGAKLAEDKFKDKWWEVDVRKLTYPFRTVPESYAALSRPSEQLFEAAQILTHGISVDVAHDPKPLNHRQRHNRAAVERAYSELMGRPPLHSAQK